ncbi:MAG: hypothetical protein NC905_00690 [Candidatus Omnitrophica bacterium]|nr:hypothetical protein [Candidatus Omnitrophota bacterium]MCM8776772.1 hypothetical protein [Candidatus Omnitrophota bacterium]
MEQKRILHKKYKEKQVEIKDMERFSDWKSLFGRSFSGCVSYKNEFFLEDPSEMKLTITSLRYSAKIYVNGIYVGAITYQPYQIITPKDITRKGRNIIYIDVYNTLANISRSRETKKHISRPFSNYYLYSEPFDRKRLKSGISGVSLFTLS